MMKLERNYKTVGWCACYELFEVNMDTIIFKEENYTLLYYKKEVYCNGIGYSVFRENY